MGHCGLVEPKGLLDGQVEGADQNGVKDGGHGDDGQHGGVELADHIIVADDDFVSLRHNGLLPERKGNGYGI